MTQKSSGAVYAIVLAAALACASLPALAREPATSKTILTLEPDEEILLPESTIEMSAESEDIVLVIAKGSAPNPSLYVFRDGKKTGPYASLDLAMKAAYEGRANTAQRQRDCAAYRPGKAPADAVAVTDYASGGKQGVRFRGKLYGAYLMVFTETATPDGAAAYYTAADNDKAWFGCTDGRVVSFGGLPAEFKFSPDGKSAAVLAQGKLSMADMKNLAKLPPEKMAVALKEQEKKYLYTIDGKIFGPFESDFESHSFWYPQSSNDLYFRVGDDVLRNGTLLFKAESFDSCGFYPSPDGKTYAMFTYENVAFSDGKKYPAALDVAVVQRAGKTVYRWITLENNRKLVVYERAM
jgi:hypothetical protein